MGHPWRVDSSDKEGQLMSDNLKNRGPQDRERVNVNESWEVDWWCGKWNITKAQLHAAVRAVGVMTKDVAKHLGKPYPV